MKRRSFLALLGLLPVALKAAVQKAPEPVKKADPFIHPFSLSDGTGSCSGFDTEPLTWEKLQEIYDDLHANQYPKYKTPDLSHWIQK